MKVTFKIVPHSVRPDTEVCEIWLGTKMVAAMYQDGSNEDMIRLFTNHLIGSMRTPEGVKPALFQFVFDPVPQKS